MKLLIPKLMLFIIAIGLMTLTLLVGESVGCNSYSTGIEGPRRGYCYIEGSRNLGALIGIIVIACIFVATFFIVLKMAGYEITKRKG